LFLRSVQDRKNTYCTLPVYQSSSSSSSSVMRSGSEKYCLALGRR
jgi:hypothetical protein